MNAFLKLKKKLFRNSFLKHLSVLIAGTALSNLLIVMTTPILTRLYTPEDFGSFSIFLSILYTLTIIVSLRYETAIPLPEKDDDAFHLLVLSSVITVMMSVLTFGVVIFLHFTDLLHIPGIDGYIWLLSLSLLGIGLFQVMNCWAIRTEEFEAVSRAKVMMNSGQVGPQMLLGFLSPSVLSLLIGEIAGRFFGVVTYVRKLKQDRLRYHPISMVKMKSVMKRYKSFPLVSSWSALLHNAGSQLPVFFLVAVFDTKTAGFFFLAQKILTIPEGLIGFSASQVYLSQAAQQARLSYREFRTFFWDIVKKMIMMGTVTIGAIALIAPPLIQIVFGNVWTDTGAFIQVLSIMYVMRIIIHPINANFYVFEALKTQTLAEVIRFSMIVLSLIPAMQFAASPIIAILWISIGTSIGYFFVGFFAWFIMKRNYIIAEAEANE